MAINIAHFQVPQGETAMLSSKVELRGPRGEEDVRAHENWRVPSVAMVRHQGKFFVVDPTLRPVLAGHWFVAELRAACSSKEEFFVWPVRDDDETMRQAADAAVDGWTYIEWVTKAKKYTVTPAKESHADPVWPEGAFQDLLEAALNDRILSNAEDEVVLAIRKKKVKIKAKVKEKEVEKKAKAK